MEEFVNVPVPREHVTKVYAFLAGLAEIDAVPVNPLPGGTQGAEPDENWPSKEWTVEDLRSLASSSLPAIQRTTRLLDVLAEQPGDKFSTSDLVGRLNVERNQLRGSLAALTRHIHAHYDRGNWPMTWSWGDGTVPDYKSEAFYSIDEATALRWKEARSAV